MKIAFVQAHDRHHGFTLIELLVVVAIAAILLAVATPSLRGIIISNRVQSASSEFQSALAMARSEAVKRGGDARVTIVANQKTGNAPNWASGVTVFYDTTSNANNNAPPTDASTLLMRTSAFPDGVVVNISFPHLIYNGLGRTISSNGAFLAGTAAFGAADTTWHCNIISMSGRTRSARVTNAVYTAPAPAGGCQAN